MTTPPPSPAHVAQSDKTKDIHWGWFLGGGGGGEGVSICIDLTDALN